MFQRASLYWELSELSPVSRANSSGSPVTGPTLTALIARTMASATCAVSISWGRYADAKSPGTGPVALGSSYRSVHSTRAGDWWSTTCTSLSWAKASRPCGASWRAAAGRDAEVGPHQSRVGRLGHDLAVALRVGAPGP